MATSTTPTPWRSLPRAEVEVEADLPDIAGHGQPVI